jgi:hypothetical protein
MATVAVNTLLITDDPLAIQEQHGRETHRFL